MNNVIISFLGTSNYQECYYSLDNIKGEKVKYIQEDIIYRFCNNSNEEYIFRIFLTDKAKEKNWLDNGQGNNNLGLKSRIEKYCNENSIKLTIEEINIPEGKSEEEIWDIFEKIYEKFNKDENIIFDITHSFRSLPMLLIVLLTYTKLLKNIKINKILYGAFEAGKKENDDMIAPIFDLTSFADLQNWTIATQNFIKNGISNDLYNLTREKIDPILKEKKGKDEEIKEIKGLINALNTLVNNIYIVRGKSIVEFSYENYPDFLENTLPLKNPLIKPLKPLMEIIYKKVSEFKKDNVNNGILAIEWCLEHNLYQQALTLMQEFIITIVSDNFSLDWKIKKIRNIINFILCKADNNNFDDICNELDLTDSKINIDILKEIFNSDLIKNLSKKYNELTQLRNDVNHAGFLDNARNDYSKIYNEIEENFKQIKKILFPNQ